MTNRSREIKVARRVRFITLIDSLGELQRFAKRWLFEHLS